MAYISGGSNVNDAIILTLIKKLMLRLMLTIIIMLMCVRAKSFTWNVFLLHVHFHANHIKGFV